jgi:chromosome segregation protein
LKIKLEETRVSDPEEIKAEFERVEERIEFFEREIEDLEQTRNRLENLIDDIETTAEEKFLEGIADINEAFGDFFATMFGGGEAKLAVTEHPAGRNITVDEADDTPEETERGVAIQVKLPNKKVRGLEVLSGGERALTSIALLFALSQINPPPFVVLDEADAALDEANSKRFGDMIKRLSKHSQLVIITHNRETMRRADLLYGVTMDQNGSSRLLSLNFSEAVDKIEQ